MPARPRRLIVALLLSLAALGGAIARPGVPGSPPSDAVHGWAAGAVYTVADVERALAQAPGGWVGRTVLVWGRAAIERTWCPPDSLVTRLALLDSARAGGLEPLYLRWGSPDPLLASLRRLPLVGRFAPPPQRLYLGRVAIYRVRLDGLSTTPCGSADVVLLDAAPDYR